MFKKAFPLLFALILVPCISGAEIKTYTHTVEQSFGRGQSADDSRIAAIAKAKREVLEKAGTYLESLPIVKNSMVEKDEILALAIGVLKPEIVSQENVVTEQAFRIIVKAKVDINTNHLEERVKKLLQDRSLLEEYNEILKHEKELLARIQELEKENQKLKALPLEEQKKERLKNRFKEATQGLTASELRKEALVFWENGKYTDPNKALKYLNQAIDLDSSCAVAYKSRGIAWNEKDNYDQAISDYNKAIELNPGYADAYHHRGVSWFKKGDYDRAISDYNKAIELNPKDDETHYTRGLSWVKKGDYDRAISDFSKTVHLNPRNAEAYHNRGVLWAKRGDFDQAILDYNKAIELNPKYAIAYYNRGTAWAKKNDPDRACSNWQRACELKVNCKTFSLMKKEGVCQ